MEGFFMSIARDPDMPGYEPFEKEAWGFKVRMTPDPTTRCFSCPPHCSMTD